MAYASCCSSREPAARSAKEAVSHEAPIRRTQQNLYKNYDQPLITHKSTLEYKPGAPAYLFVYDGLEEMDGRCEPH